MNFLFIDGDIRVVIQLAIIILIDVVIVDVVAVEFELFRVETFAIVLLALLSNISFGVEFGAFCVTSNAPLESLKGERRKKESSLSFGRSALNNQNKHFTFMNFPSCSSIASENVPRRLLTSFAIRCNSFAFCE